MSSLSVSGVQTGQNVLDDSQEDEFNGIQPHPKKRKQTDTGTKKSCMKTK